MRLFLRNWRCVEKLEVELAPVTVFIGKNASGKSSIIYALYFLTKILNTGVERVDELLNGLYGVGLREVARLVNNEPQFPVEIEVMNKSKRMKFYAESLNKINVDGEKIWSEVYLMPSHRLSIIKSIQYIDRRWLTTVKKPEEFYILWFVKPIFDFLFRLPLPPPAMYFIEDFQKILIGKQYPKRLLIEDAGVLEIHALPISYTRVLEYIDEATGQHYPADLAPDGALDLLLIKAFLRELSENDLLLIEEPEIHKNPVMLLNIADDIAKAVERGAYVFCSTHSDVFVHAIAHVFKDPSKVAIYYLERSKEFPWTIARRIEVYEDGTIEEFPGAEEIIARLF